MLAKTIDDVLAELENIITEAIQTNNRMGYFAALYYKVTASVKEGIAKGLFENGPQMELFDVLFASRYLDALNAWKNNQPVTASWQVAFDATKNSSPLVLQHLLLGMNAHINLDLGIAAVGASGGKLAGIQKDFDSINAIISSLTNQVLSEIDRVWPLSSILGFHASDQKSVLIQFSIDTARDGAWCFAEALAAKQGADYDTCIAKRDQAIKKLGDCLTENRGFIRSTIWLIHLFELKTPGKIIKVMHGAVKQNSVISS